MQPGFYRALIEGVPDPILVITADGRVRWASLDMERVIGLGPGEITRAGSNGLVHPADLEAVRAVCEGAVWPGRRFEVRLRHRDGSWRRVEGLFVNMLGDPDVCGIVVSGRRRLDPSPSDEAERRARAEHERSVLTYAEKLWRSEERYRSVIEQTSEGIYLVDAWTGRVIESNPALREMLGYPADEDVLRGSLLEDLLAHTPQDIEENLRRTLREGRRFVGDRKYRCRDGSVLDVEVGTSVIRHAGEEIVCVAVRDVTGRREAERKIREAETRYRALVEQIPVAAYTQDVQTGQLNYLSPRFEEIAGYTVEEYLANPELRLGATIHPEDYERVVAENERADRTGEPYSAEYRKIRKDGRVIWVRDEAVLVRDEDGRPLYWQGILEDITHRKQSEEAVRESEERFRLTFELAAVGMAQVGLDGRWLRANDKLLEIVGYERKELLAKTFAEITHPLDVESDLENARRVRLGEISTYATEKRYIRKDGSVVWVNLTVSLARSYAGDPDYFISVIEDITERKLAELVPDPLTPREHQTLGLIAQGMTNRQIGEVLHHSMGTAKLDARRVLEKLQATSRGEAAARAVEIGLVSPVPSGSEVPPG